MKKYAEISHVHSLVSPKTTGNIDKVNVMNGPLPFSPTAHHSSSTSTFIDYDPHGSLARNIAFNPLNNRHAETRMLAKSEKNSSLY